MSARRPLAIDLFCGLGGWADGLLAEGWDVLGFDIERHEYGGHRYPGTLVLQDVLTLHGSQFGDAALIVASPPCQFFSYTAMPWTIAKQLARDVRADPERLAAELALFNACFRIQREACEAARQHIPLIVENVRGAIPWVGRSRWNFGSFHLWGDVPALMPITVRAQKFNLDGTNHGQDNGAARIDVLQTVGATESARATGYKSNGMNWSDQTQRGQDFTRIAGRQAMEGTKGAGSGAASFDANLCVHSSHSPARKAASAMIAKIPEPLARWIARTFKPDVALAARLAEAA